MKMLAQLSTFPSKDNELGPMMDFVLELGMVPCVIIYHGTLFKDNDKRAQQAREASRDGVKKWHREWWERVPEAWNIDFDGLAQFYESQVTLQHPELRLLFDWESGGVWPGCSTFEEGDECFETTVDLMNRMVAQAHEYGSTPTSGTWRATTTCRTRKATRRRRGRSRRTRGSSRWRTRTISTGPRGRSSTSGRRSEARARRGCRGPRLSGTSSNRR
jgi:hypothetical protein